MNTDDFCSEKALAGYPAMVEFLCTEVGFKTSKSTISKLGAPSINDQLPPEERLPIIGYWGLLPIAMPSGLRAWAWRRARKSRTPKMPAVASLEI
jgi:hypothetical protein